MLPRMLSVTPYFPDYNFVIAAAKEQPDEMYAPWLQAYPHVRVVRDQTYSLLQQSVAALVKSGHPPSKPHCWMFLRWSVMPETGCRTISPDYSSGYSISHW
jgi:hypothetical protein